MDSKRDKALPISTINIKNFKFSRGLMPDRSYMFVGITRNVHVDAMSRNENKSMLLLCTLTWITLNC
eukprot:snap_masked-scaffold_82-processed-gene-0.28-mRNA-1 protein AED:1.00 eAED:1.00 QI:0/0/0/0/1/1/2/0/66